MNFLFIVVELALPPLPPPPPPLHLRELFWRVIDIPRCWHNFRWSKRFSKSRSQQVSHWHSAKASLDCLKVWKQRLALRRTKQWCFSENNQQLPYLLLLFFVFVAQKERMDWNRKGSKGEISEKGKNFKDPFSSFFSNERNLFERKVFKPDLRFFYFAEFLLYNCLFICLFIWLFIFSILSFLCQSAAERFLFVRENRCCAMVEQTPQKS